MDEFIVYVVAFSHVYLRRQKFSFPTYMARKTSARNGVDLWRRLLEVCHGYRDITIIQSCSMRFRVRMLYRVFAFDTRTNA